MQRKHLLIGALVALPLLAGGGAAAFAASTGSSGTSPAAAFLADVASHLGISTTTLQSAVEQAQLDQVQQMVNSGKLSSSQAAQIESNIKSGKIGAGFGMMFGRHDGGPMMGGRGAMQAAATYLGLTQQQLMSDLRSGKSLSSIASSTGGKTLQGLEAAITTAMQQEMQQAVTNGHMTQQQLTQAESNLQTFVQQFVTRSGFGMHGDGHGWGPPQNAPQGSAPPSGGGSGTTTN